MSALDRQVLHALPITVYSTDLEGRIVVVNRAAARGARDDGAAAFVGESAVVGTALRDAITDPAAREKFDLALERVRHGRAPSVSWEMRTGSPADERLILVQLSPMHDGRTLAGFVLCTVDLTSADRARAALHESAVAMSRAVSLDRVFHEAAQQLRRTLGADRLVIGLTNEGGELGVAYAVGFEPGAGDLARRFADGWREALAAGHVTVRARDGHAELSAPLDSDVGAIGVLTVLTDADALAGAERHGDWARTLSALAAQIAAAIERVGLVRRAERTQRLETIGEVAAGVAHELRNPLFGISSAAQLLRYRAREDPVIEKNVGRILREVERLNRMTTALLDLGRPQPARLVPGDPDAIWDTVLELERGRLESRALSVQHERALPSARCGIDGEQLAQLFVNLLANAAEAAPEGSAIAVRSATLPGGGWRCRVHNGGAPLSAETLARAFEIFYSTRSDGAGIGLARSERIVAAHGGTIALEAARAGGATVTVLLPPIEDAKRDVAR